MGGAVDPSDWLSWARPCCHAAVWVSRRLPSASPLELQVLAGLALSDGETAEEDLSSLAAWLGCDLSALGHVTRGMLPEELVERAGIEEEGDERIALTEAGGLVVEAWIGRTVALFPG